MDQNHSVYSVCIDLSKAFDFVSYKIWIDKLKYFGFKDESLKLLSSFLSHRSHKVVFKITVSDIIETVQDVPQGTLLGPLLFNIFITDVTKYISKERRVIQYVDDCLLYPGNPRPDIAIENLQVCLENLESFSRSNQVTLKASKTEFINFLSPKMKVSNKQLIVVGSDIKLKIEVKVLSSTPN